MPVWNNSLMNTHYENREEGSEILPELDMLCSVRIEGSVIEIQYEVENEQHTYFGHERTPGYYSLGHSSGVGTATLFHPSPDALSLFGTWDTNPYRGLWRIKLGSKVSN
jgi:hypothetical protein